MSVVLFYVSAPTEQSCRVQLRPIYRPTALLFPCRCKFPQAQDLARAVEQNAVLKFVLDSLPIAHHTPCEVLGELWGSKVKFRKKLYTDVMANLLDDFGIYISVMNGRGRQKGIVLLGPGKAKPLDAPDQPLGAARDLVRAGTAERKTLLKEWTTPCDTERKLRVGTDGARTWGLERTPGRDFDPRAAARAAEAVAAAEGSDDDDDNEAEDDKADDKADHMSDGGEDASPSSSNPR